MQVGGTRGREVTSREEITYSRVEEKEFHKLGRKETRVEETLQLSFTMLPQGKWQVARGRCSRQDTVRAQTVAGTGGRVIMRIEK